MRRFVLPGGLTLNRLKGLLRLVSHGPTHVSKSLITGHQSKKVLSRLQLHSRRRKTSPKPDVCIGVTEAIKNDPVDFLVPTQGTTGVTET